MHQNKTIQSNYNTKNAAGSPCNNSNNFRPLKLVRSPLRLALHARCAGAGISGGRRWGALAGEGSWEPGLGMPIGTPIDLSVIEVTGV